LNWQDTVGYDTTGLEIYGSEDDGGRKNSIWIRSERWQIGHVIWCYVVVPEEMDPRASDQDSNNNNSMI
jgi:hypothetical protein